MKLKKPKIFEETNEWVEVEIPEGKSEQYDLDGFEMNGGGQDMEGNFFEYYTKYKDTENKK